MQAEGMRLVERIKILGLTVNKKEVGPLFKTVKVEKPNDTVDVTIITASPTADMLEVEQFRKNLSTGKLIPTTEEPLIIKGKRIAELKHDVSSWLPKSGSIFERLLGKREINLEAA